MYGITASDINDSRHEPHGANSLLTLADVRDWQQTRPDAAEWVTRHYWQSRLGEMSATFRHRHGVKLWAGTVADGLWPGCCPETLAGASTSFADAAPRPTAARRPEAAGTAARPRQSRQAGARPAR